MKKYLLCPAVILVMLLTKSLYAQTNGPVVIPVVFHVLSKDTSAAENISKVQVLDAVRILNQDYNNTNTDSAAIAPAYRNNVANMGITFKLAGIDPNGNCTHGIDRITTIEADSGGADAAYLNGWPREKYLNIWTYSQLSTGLSTRVLSVWDVDTLPAQDGIVILSSYVGSIGTGSISTSGTLTRLTAECFGLIRITYAGQGFCIDIDSVADTPPAAETSPCDTDILSCDGHTFVNGQNYMGYTTCPLMFTNGQKQRVYGFLNRSTAGRNNLWTTDNLTATGTNDSVAVVCTPTSIQNINGNTLAVFPNPFNQQITIQGLSATAYNIYVTDITGRNLLTFNHVFADGGGNATINLSSIQTAGIYFVRVYNATGAATVKVVRN